MARRHVDFAGHALQIDDGGKLTVVRRSIDTSRAGDYGADPLPDGTFRMVPSGDVVSLDERNRRLQR